MTVIVPAGILISICGLYLSLHNYSHRQQTAPETSDVPTNTRFLLSRPVIFAILAFCGLAMLGLAHASSGDLEITSPVLSGMHGTVFFFGAGLALAGALGSVLSRTSRNVVMSLAVLGTGTATVLGVSGNVVGGSLSLTGAAVCGWWLHRQNHHLESSDRRYNTDSTNSRMLDVDDTAVAEPLLTSIAVVLFCWILGAALHSAVAEESIANLEMRGSKRALPRVAYKVGSPLSSTAKSEGDDAQTLSASATDPLSDRWMFWCAAGLLAVTVGLGYSRSDVNKSRCAETENARTT